MFLFASLYSIGQKINRSVYYDHISGCKWTIENVDRFKQIFPSVYSNIKIMHPNNDSKTSLSILHPQTNELIGCCEYINPLNWVNITTPYLVITSWLQSFKYFEEYEKQIRDFFTCDRNIMVSIENYAEELFEGDRAYKLCVHIRRKDYVTYGLGTNEEFVIHSIPYVESVNASNVSVLFIGDDYDFMKLSEMKINTNNNLSTYVSNISLPGQDLCFGINYCNALIITSPTSTFGWWIGYLKKLEGPVFYNSNMSRTYWNLPTTIKDDKEIYESIVFPHNWIRLHLNNSVVKGEPDWFNKYYSNKTI